MPASHKLNRDFGPRYRMESPEGPEDSTPSVTFNLIGKIQPDQKRLNLPDRVYASPQQAFS